MPGRGIRDARAVLLGAEIGTTVAGHHAMQSLPIENTAAPNGSRAPSSRQGLSNDEAARRLEQHGSNEIRRGEGASPWKILAGQFKGALIWPEYGWVMSGPYPTEVEVVDLPPRA